MINRLADLVLKYYEITPPIKDIKSIVEVVIGGYIKEDDELSGCSDGFIMKYGNSFKIVVSPFQNELRKNFTIAHELGHLFLHMGYIIDDELWNKQTDKIYYRSGSTLMEYQANEFAAALLMPKEMYEEVFEENLVGDEIDMNNIAKKFNVSLQAAINRARFLGLL